MNKELNKEQKELLQDLDALIKNSYSFIGAMDLIRSTITPECDAVSKRETIKMTLDILKGENPTFF